MTVWRVYQKTKLKRGRDLFVFDANELVTMAWILVID
jgi:hypothetical protein